MQKTYDKVTGKYHETTPEEKDRLRGEVYKLWLKFGIQGVLNALAEVIEQGFGTKEDPCPEWEERKKALPAKIRAAAS